MSVVIVGAGAAGVAAAVTLAGRGVRGVRVLTAGSGASALFGGTLDVVPWQAQAPIAPLQDPALETLELYRVPPQGALVATMAGVLRPARGIDRALLDLTAVRESTLLVPRAEHHGWDAGALARSLADSDRARTQKLAFSAVDATITRYRDERALTHAEIAARHDDPTRLAWLGDRLREAAARTPAASAILLPPWLGIDRPRADALSERVGIPCGEVACDLASAAGLRFERARDRVFATMGVEARRAFVTRIDRLEDRFSLTTEEGDSFEASCVLLATGGLVGGGLTFEPDVPFRCTIEVECVIGARQKPLFRPGSASGAPPESLAWPDAEDAIMDRVGILVGTGGSVKDGAPGLYAAGDVVADRPRTWLDAWAAGVSFADFVAQELVGDLEGEVLALGSVGR